ncbi:hypothetical protein, partial [Streptomyces chartreusis]|uniref:hypothetical protein n=1 Tax=Streptomyces chartreusis TaxID=1969 RepID=UPI00362A12A5
NKDLDNPHSCWSEALSAFLTDCRTARFMKARGWAGPQIRQQVNGERLAPACRKDCDQSAQVGPQVCVSLARRLAVGLVSGCDC